MVSSPNEERMAVAGVEVEVGLVAVVKVERTARSRRLASRLRCNWCLFQSLCVLRGMSCDSPNKWEVCAGLRLAL